MKSYYVYILTNMKNGTLYVGITSNIARRIWLHKNKLYEGFTKTYNLTRLAYYTQIYDVREAIKYEKRLKRWRRQWKIELIEKHNPAWRDLSEDFLDPG